MLLPRARSETATVSDSWALVVAAVGTSPGGFEETEAFAGSRDVVLGFPRIPSGKAPESRHLRSVTSKILSFPDGASGSPAAGGGEPWRANAPEPRNLRSIVSNGAPSRTLR